MVKNDISEVVLRHHEFAYRKNKDKGDADSSHITSEAFGFLAEVEETKHKDGQARDNKERHIDEWGLAVDIKQRQ